MQFKPEDLFDKWFEEGKKELDSLKPFWEAFGNETDRAIGIVSACLLDSLLEGLIKTSYIKDSNGLPPEKESMYNVSLRRQKRGINGQKGIYTGTDYQ